MHDINVERNWLEGLPDHVKNAIDDVSTFRVFDKGETIIEFGAPGNFLYQVMSGRLESRVPFENGISFLCEMYRAGDCFAEAAVINGHNVMATTFANTESNIRMISKQSFQTLQDKHPEINNRLLELLASKVGMSAISTAINNTQLLPTKLAARLFYEMKVINIDHDVQGRDLFLTQENLADMLGSSRDSLSKILSHWSKEAIVNSRYGKITILDEERLMQIAMLPNPLSKSSKDKY